MRSSSKEGLNCAEVLVAPEAGGGNLKVCSERFCRFDLFAVRYADLTSVWDSEL